MVIVGEKDKKRLRNMTGWINDRRLALPPRARLSCTMNTLDDADERRVSLSVLIHQIDHILAPTGPLDNAILPRVPVIRIYGASSTGEKACVHVHQVYPYFFVEYPGNMTPDHGESSCPFIIVTSSARQSTITLPSYPYP